MKKILAITLYALVSTFSYAAHGECAPDMRLDTISIVTPDFSTQMVSHTIVFNIAIPAAAFNDRLVHAPLARLLPGTRKIPAVVSTRELTLNPFGTPKAPRVVCLADGNTAVEEVLDNLPGQLFRYKVWNYSLKVAKPIEYGLGTFALQALDSEHTRVTWTYSFKLRENTFPGYLGGFGRWLFKESFVERDYADMMSVSAKAMVQYFGAEGV